MSSKGIILFGVIATFSIIFIVAISMGYGTNNYLFQDGSTPLTANWNAGSYNIRANNFLADYSAIFGLADSSYSFPTSDGLENQILVTDGDGSLTFGVIPRAGAYFYYLHNATSDIATYYNMTVQLPYDVQQNFTFPDVSNDYVFINFYSLNTFI